MERRIKLTDEQVRIVVDSLEDTRDSAIDTKRDVEAAELPGLNEHIEQVAELAGAFEAMLPEE